MNIYKKVLSILLSAVMTAVLFTGCKKDTFEVKKIDEYFYEAGTYTFWSISFSLQYL